MCIYHVAVTQFGQKVTAPVSIFLANATASCLAEEKEEKKEEVVVVIVVVRLQVLFCLREPSVTSRLDICSATPESMRTFPVSR